MCADFATLPDEQQGGANYLLGELRRRGYRVVIEKQDLSLPATPTLRGKRGHQTHYFLIRKELSSGETDQWRRYCCSCDRDTRVSFVVFEKDYARRPQRNFGGKGLGLIILNGGGLNVEYEARDLAFRAQPPDRASLKRRVRELLGESFDRVENGDWRAGFEEACGVLEEQCRGHLIKCAKMGRANFIDRGRVKNPTEAQISRMTMGALKNVLCSLVTQNQVEAQLCSALTALTPDRNLRTHQRRSARVEAALRRRVGQHIWLISNTLSLLS